MAKSVGVSAIRRPARKNLTFKNSPTIQKDKVLKVRTTVMAFVK